MTTRVDVEQIETTKSEKLLATVLAAFLLIGLLWVYFHIDVERDYVYRSATATLSPAERAALERRDGAGRALRKAGRAQTARRRELVDRREAYRTALDEGRRDPALAHRYQSTQSAYERAQRRRRAAQRAFVAAQPAARAAERRRASADKREEARVDGQQRHDGRVGFVRRLAFVLVWLGAAYALLERLRRRRSRWLLAGMAPIAAVALLALVMAVDYLTDYVEVTDLGVLVLSAAGALMTIAAFAALQRYLARRLPERRVRRRECPFCGYPTGEAPHCEGCGRDVIGECATCHASRRVGTRHCRSCGTA
ncbi:MAG: zinc ribbon domain-containing protein [Actinomycetota bacterium]|nr:zinc ribbon domain-containing protein [Actinomycetota bacterium]